MDMEGITERGSVVFYDAVIKHFSQFFLGLGQYDWIVFLSLLGGILAMGFFLGRTRSYRTTVFQNRGEALVSQIILENFGPPDYHLINHATLQMENGTTQVDHILVSRFGVFVVETKDYTGWIFGSASQRNWTKVLFKVKYSFQNPIHQNLRHVRAVRQLLSFLPPDSIKSVVVFTGDAEFKTEVPLGVIYASGLAEFLKSYDDEIISTDQLQLSVGRLEIARYSISGETDIEHARNLERRHGGAA